MPHDGVEDQLTGVVRRDFQSAGDALGAVLAATTAAKRAEVRCMFLLSRRSWPEGVLEMGRGIARSTREATTRRGS